MTKEEAITHFQLEEDVDVEEVVLGGKPYWLNPLTGEVVEISQF